MFGFWINADGATGARGFLFGEINHVLKSDDFEGTIEPGITICNALNRSQLLDFRKREIDREPVGVTHAINDRGALAIGEFCNARNVGRTTQHRLMPCDQNAVFGRHQVRLNHVSAHRDGEAIRFQGVLRHIARRAAMTNDQRCLPVQRVPGNGGGGQRERCRDGNDQWQTTRQRQQRFHAKFLKKLSGDQPRVAHCMRASAAQR